MTPGHARNTKFTATLGFPGVAGPWLSLALALGSLCIACESQTQSHAQGDYAAQSPRSLAESLERSIQTLVNLGKPLLFLEDYVRDASREVPRGDAWERFVSELDDVAAMSASANHNRKAELAKLVHVAVVGLGSNIDFAELANNLERYTDPRNIRMCGYFFRDGLELGNGFPLTHHGPVLRNAVRDNHYESTDDVLRAIKANQKIALVHNSDSTQSTSHDNWRILLFGLKGRVALGFRGKRPQPGALDDIEVIFFDCLAGRERFALIRRDDNAGESIWHSSDETLHLPVLTETEVLHDKLEPQQMYSQCAKCHGGLDNPADAHKNWYDYESWVGLAGGEHKGGTRLGFSGTSVLEANTFLKTDDYTIYPYPGARENAAIDRFFEGINQSGTNEADPYVRYAQFSSMQNAGTHSGYPTIYDALSQMNTDIGQDLHHINIVRIASQLVDAVKAQPEASEIIRLMQHGMSYGSGSDICKHLPQTFAKYCDEDPSGDALRTAMLEHEAELWPKVIQKTGEIRQYFYQKAAESFPPDPEIDEGLHTLEQVMELDTVDNAGRSSFDANPINAERLPFMMFLARELGIVTRHWALTPSRWGESYQFMDGKLYSFNKLPILLMHW